MTLPQLWLEYEKTRQQEQSRWGKVTSDRFFTAKEDYQLEQLAVYDNISRKQFSLLHLIADAIESLP